ncbi:hypothetical protein EUX98_g1203 [Antrodiella citrinella]|uniref:DNA polymerase phi subunit n=1 Tax=Antrodiella citrinella TaxID=2447956 RepID=A0A4S4N215_9APHY|nr:hypothetical protein EUX98_g1203 [Antrodiella citrinella]
MDASRTQGSATGQEERDVLFARLFGLTSVIQSGLITRQTPLPSSASSSATPSDAATFAAIVDHLLALADSKSWLREGAWWGLALAVDGLGAAANLPWQEEALATIIETLYVTNKQWIPEKIALTVKLQKLSPNADWKKLLSPTLKHPEILASGNFVPLARILKDIGMDEDEGVDSKSTAGSWTPTVPFVWDIVLDQMLSPSDAGKSSNRSFPEFFRILVDESLFAIAASPERKYWGFQIFRKSLFRASAADMPMLFTKNFMRTWINHLSNSDRYLHKAAKQVANDILVLVKQNPKLAFTLILQLTGVNGSHQFDRLTKTKTVETILTSMDVDGIQSYLDYLLQQVNENDGSTDDISAINARRLWIVDQMAALLRNGAIPKTGPWVQQVLDWLVTHGLFTVRKKSAKSNLVALHTVPSPVFSDDLHKSCRLRLLSCLADLTSHASVIQVDDKSVKVTGTASDGELWISKCLATIEQLADDADHVKWFADIDKEDLAQRRSAIQLVRRLHQIWGDKEDLARGTELLLAASIVRQCCSSDEDGEGEDSDALEDCTDAARRLFPEKKKKKASSSETDSHAEPIDVLIDIVIRFLEAGTNFMRSVANQTFTLLSGSLEAGSIDLIVAQLASPDPAELAADSDDDMDEDTEAGEDAKESDNESGDDEDSDDDGEIEDDPLLRAAIEEALSVNGIKASEGDSDDDSDEEFMDDEQMMAIDDQLAAVFKARADERGGRGKSFGFANREATHFKNRVLDLVDLYLKKHSSSEFAIRFLSPLAELITGSGTDEKQLIDKATGILRSRLGKSKETPAIIDKEDAVAILEDLHVRARTAVSSEILATLSACSLYLCRALLQSDAKQKVVDTYRESLKDFMTRKASRLNNHFFQDSFRKCPAVGWEVRSALLELGGKAVNGYRKAQAYQLLQVVMNQLSTLHVDDTEILAFMPSLSTSIEEILTTACEDGSLTAPQAREVLRLAQSAARHTKRVASTIEEVSSVWQPTRWQGLARKLSSSDSLKSSTGLQNMCKQVAQLGEAGTATDKKTQESSKRKIDVSEDDIVASKPTKRKKTKKAQKTKA